MSLGFARERFKLPFGRNPMMRLLSALVSDNAIEMHLPRNQGPVVEIQDYGRIVILTGLVGKIRAGPVLGSNEPEPQSADVGAVRQFGQLGHLRPREYCVAGTQRRHLPAAVDGA